MYDPGAGMWLVQGPGTDLYPNDLWQFNAATNEWSWVAGTYLLEQVASCSQCPPPGVYGTLGTPASTNTPGGRLGAMHWTDVQGNLWLFGGRGPDANDVEDLLNDLWEFNPDSMEWTWMGGSSTINFQYNGEPGVYGTLGQFAPGNMPGSRQNGVSWTDPGGEFWLFGGVGLDKNGTKGDLNDLWTYDPVKSEWAWMAGSDTISPISGNSGAYGVLGKPDVANTPGSRDSAVGWTDQSGNLWLFGGMGFDEIGKQGYLNDLWEFDPKARAWAWMGGSSTLPCQPLNGVPTFLCGQAGQYGILGTEAPTNVPGGRYRSTVWVDSRGNT